MLTHAMRRELIKRNQITAEDACAIALQEVQTKSRTSSFPSDCIDLADRIADTNLDAILGPVTNRERNILAKGLPRHELTKRYAPDNRYGGVNPHQKVKKAA